MRTHRRLLYLFALVCTLISMSSLTGCGGGGGGGGSTETSINEQTEQLIPPDQTGIAVRSQNGRVQLPASSVISASNLSVTTTFGDAQVGSDGSFSVPANQESVQAVAAMDLQGNPVLLGLVGAVPGQEGIVLNARTTAISLVFLHPYLANVDKEAAQKLTAFLETLTEIGGLEAAIQSQLEVGGNLKIDDPVLKTAWETAVGAAIRRIQQGELSRSRGVTPDTAQSFVLVQPVNDTDPRAIQLNVQNFRLRWVQLWATPIDNNDQPVGSTTALALLPSADNLSPIGLLGSIFTGQVFNPSETSVTVAIPDGATAVRLEAWGPGRRDADSVTTTEFLSKAYAPTIATAVVNFGGEAIDALVGVKLISRGRGRPTELFRNIENLLEFEEMRGIAEDFAKGDVLKGAFGTLKFLIGDERGHDFLYGLAQDIGVQGLTKTALKKAAFWLKIYGLNENSLNIGATLGSVDAARPKEVFKVTSGAVDVGDVFRATLSWNQSNDIDLHTFSPDGRHSSYESKEIPAGELDIDDIDGFGPENFTARQALPGIYRIAVNYYGNGEQSTNVHVHVRTPQGTSTFGPFTMTTPNGNSDYPLSGNSGSWWRPCDIEVKPNGSVQILAPDLSVPLSRAISRSSSRKKSYER